MTSNNKTIQPWLALTWSLFTTSFILWLFFEKMVFSHYFGKMSDYIELSLVLAGSTLLVSFAGKFLRARSLAGIIFACIMAATIGWFSIIIFGCGAGGLIIMLELYVGILPALLIEWSRRCVPAAGDENTAITFNSIIALAISGVLLLVAGLLSQIAYYWAIIVAFMDTGAMVVAFIVLFWKSSDSKAIDARATPDTNLFFRDLIVVILIGVLGFSMLEPVTTTFSLLVFFGLSMVIFSISYFILARAMNDKNALQVLEGVVFVLFIVKTVSVMNNLNAPVITIVPIDLPGFVIGFASGYLWTRVYQVAQGITYQKAFPVAALVNNTRNFSNKLVTSLLLFWIAGCCAFNIEPSYSATTSIIYSIGLTISTVGLLLWTISVWKIRKKRTRPVSLDSRASMGHTR